MEMKQKGKYSPGASESDAAAAFIAVEWSLWLGTDKPAIRMCTCGAVLDAG